MTQDAADEPFERHPDAHVLKLALNKPYRERQQKLRWLDDLAAEQDGEGCREWPWARNTYGYGVVRWNGANARAGHAILELSGRPRPTGAHMLHSCDNPPCVAPWHLDWGTQSDNVRDMDERGRRVRAPGSRNGLAKLTEDDVRAIRATSRAVTNRSLAEQYGVHFTTLGKIRSGKIWRHVKETA